MQAFASAEIKSVAGQSGSPVFQNEKLVGLLFATKGSKTYITRVSKERVENLLTGPIHKITSDQSLGSL